MPAAGWSQVHADSASQGSRFGNTLDSSKSVWSVDVGHIVFSSPVIGRELRLESQREAGESRQFQSAGWSEPREWMHVARCS
jgi:hypothetical protein